MMATDCVNGATTPPPANRRVNYNRPAPNRPAQKIINHQSSIKTQKPKPKNQLLTTNY